MEAIIYSYAHIALMKFRNPFKRRLTAAEILQRTREIIVKYDIPEAYYKYDNMNNPETDKPDWIRLTYTGGDEFTISEDTAFRRELSMAVGDSIGPFTAFPDGGSIRFAREHYVPLFS